MSSFMKRAVGWGFFFSFLFQKGYFFFGWGGEEGGDIPSYPKGFFFLPLWKGKGNGRGVSFQVQGPFQ